MKAQEMQLCFCTLNRVAMLKKKQTDLFAFFSIVILLLIVQNIFNLVTSPSSVNKTVCLEINNKTTENRGY
jgi:hypothetical protein